MAKVKSLADLKNLQKDLKKKVDLREKGETLEKMIQVKVGMSTCGIASGAKEVMDYMIQEFDNQAIDAVVVQTGCMGYCYAEPTIEVTKPGEEPIVFGYVDTKKAGEIIEKYVKAGELVEGIIPVNYKTIDD